MDGFSFQRMSGSVDVEVAHQPQCLSLEARRWKIATAVLGALLVLTVIALVTMTLRYIDARSTTVEVDPTPGDEAV